MADGVAKRLVIDVRHHIGWCVNVVCPDCQVDTPTIGYDNWEDCYHCHHCEAWWSPEELGIDKNPAAGFWRVGQTHG